MYEVTPFPMYARHQTIVFHACCKMKLNNTNHKVVLIDTLPNMEMA